MFRKNKKHQQPLLISNVNELPERQRERLEQSWAGVFYREIFFRLDEGIFSGLYSDLPSRPNVPVNVLVSLEFLKSGMGWSDEEMYDAFLYNVQVRYALGYHELGEGEFDLRTTYYFRQRLSQHMQEKGENLLDKAFEQVTDEQIAAFTLKTGKQRMDSTQVSSNIRQQGRLQLLVEVLQRVHRMMAEEEQSHYVDVFQPYLRGHPGHYMYRLKKEDVQEHIERAGLVMYRLLSELRQKYARHKIFQVLERVFEEHFRMEAGRVKAKPHEELSACSLQSPDDWEATVREKGKVLYQGYVSNLTETCDPENPFQLITKIQVDANHTDDPQLLLEALPNLAQRTDLETLYTDGGFGSLPVDQALEDRQIILLQTAIRGRRHSKDKLNLSDFTLHFDETGIPKEILCPQSQRVSVREGNQHKGYVAEFSPQVCRDCPFHQQKKCPAHPGRRNPNFFLYFLFSEAHVSRRRRRNAEYRRLKCNLRAAVEATIRAVKHPFPKSKLPVRGKFRIFSMMVGSAAINNVRQIQRYLTEGARKAQKDEAKKETSFSFVSFWGALFEVLLCPRWFIAPNG
jgi:hypothetical protein